MKRTKKPSTKPSCNLPSSPFMLKPSCNLPSSLFMLLPTSQIAWIARLFETTLLKRLDTPSRDQAAWINVVTPTVCQAKAEAADKLQTTQGDTHSFFLRRVAQPVVPCLSSCLIHARQPIPRLRDDQPSIPGSPLSLHLHLQILNTHIFSLRAAAL
jgi:hypothetical protein